MKPFLALLLALNCCAAGIKVYFSPHGGCTEAVVQQLNKAHSSVLVQACTVTRRGGANPDGGIDLGVEKDGQRSAMQCKQWKTWNVGVKAVREFLGALTDAGISKGNFITLRGYTGEAKKLAEIRYDSDLARYPAGPIRILLKVFELVVVIVGWL